MSFLNQKYDVELNSVGYRIKGYSRSEVPTFIPRVGAGEQTESEFNLLRAKTLQGFDGGILQRFWRDDQTVFATEGMYPIYEDGVLYPVNSFTDPSGTIGLVGKSVVTAWCTTKDYLFIAYRTFNAPTNFVKRIATDGTQQAITLPAGISGADIISSMVIWDNRLWLSAGTYATAVGGTGYMDLSATSVTSIATNWLYRLAVYKGQLYGTGAATAYRNAVLFRFTGSTSSYSVVEVGRTPNLVNSDEGELFVYNNRLFLARNDGLYAYDGILLATVEDLSKSVSENNYRFPRVLKGFMYYFMDDGFYRFNGSIIDKLYDSAEVGMPVSVCVGKNRLWIAYRNDEWGGSSRYDKAMGYNYSTGNNMDGRVAVFNGKSMYTYGRTSTFIKNPGTIDLTGQNATDEIMFFADKLWLSLYYAKNGEYYTCSTAEASLSGSKSWRVISSIDDEFPMIDKNLENVEIVFDGNVVNGEPVEVSYRTSGFEGSSGWTSLGPWVTSGDRLKIPVYLQIPAGVTYRRIQFKVTGTTTAGYGVAKFVVRNMLSPDMKLQWNFTALCYGDDPTAPLMLADNTEGTQTVRELRGNIYTARASDVPVKFVDWDQLDLNGAHNAATTTLTVNSTSLLKASTGFVQVDDEIMEYSAKTATQLTVQRGVLGTVAASHSDNAKVFPVYRVIVRQIQNERFVASDDERRTLEDKDLPTEITLVVQEV